jgi:hypothetical protein
MALCKYAQEIVAAALEPHLPERAQEFLDVETFAAKVGRAKREFTNDRRTKELVRELLANFGCDLKRTYFDVPRLRVVPHGEYLTAGVSYAYKPHRDI